MEALAQPPLSRLNPAVKQVVDQVSEERIGAIMKKLESFGTRYVGSEKDNPEHGVGGAQRWIYEQFKSYSPRLKVSYDTFTVKKSQRLPQDTELSNVVAILPGTVDQDRYVMIGGHYDSIALRRQAGQANQPNDNGPATAAEQEPLAPGVSDDASGTAAVMELARVMSQYEYKKSVIFIAFCAEEIGLNGSRNFAAKAKEQNMQIEALLNNDIIGTEISGDGRSANNRVRVFAEGPDDSPARTLARYTKEIAERYMPSMTVDMIFRRDRFSRGGDHTPFVQQGYAAVRFTTPSENYANQHTATDTFANASVPYTTRVVRMNAAVLTSLALAPKPPQVSRPRGQGRGAGGGPGAAGPGATQGAAPTGTAAAGGTGATDAAAGQGGAGRGGRGRGPAGPGLTRGTSGYDAALRWAMPNPEPDLAGYAVVIRSTTSAQWEREIYVGNVTEYAIPNLSIDDVVIGVKAIDKEGNQSLVSVYEQAPAAGANPQQPGGRGADAAQPATSTPAGRGGGGQ
jgi:hypothetical protein